MKINIQEAIFFNEDVSTKVFYPENKDIHRVNPDYPTLPKKWVEYFYSFFENIYGKLKNHNQILKL